MQIVGVLPLACAPAACFSRSAWRASTGGTIEEGGDLTTRLYHSYSIIFLLFTSFMERSRRNTTPLNLRVFLVSVANSILCKQCIILIGASILKGEGGEKQGTTICQLNLHGFHNLQQGKYSCSSFQCKLTL